MAHPIQAISQYRNQDVVDRFVVEYDVSPCEGNLIFEETLKWVWLCAQARSDRDSGIDVPTLVMDRYLQVLDEMWHHFILFTKDYSDFCELHFGFVVHHFPTPVRVKALRRQSLQNDPAVVRSTLEHRRRQFRYIYDKLGPSTLELWYGDFATRYWNLRRREQA